MLTVFWDSQSPFSEAWWKREFFIVLWSCVEASGCNSLKTSRPSGKRGTASSWQCRLHIAWATQERIHELEHPPYSPDLAQSDFHLFGLWKNHIGGKRFAEDGEVETEVRKWLRQLLKGFYAVVFNSLIKKVMGQEYRCWRICQEINVVFQASIWRVLYPFVTCLLSLPCS
jgi:hypothetical protein